MKEHLITLVVVIVALVAYNMFIKKALNISSYEEGYERI